jgi:hypothetical protein
MAETLSGWLGDIGANGRLIVEAKNGNEEKS